MAKPRTTHLQAAHSSLLQYLNCTTGHDILFAVESSRNVTAYIDVYWGSFQVSRRSTTGFCIYIGNSLTNWKSKKQATVARPSTEKEYRALKAVTIELLWLKQLLRSFDVSVSSIMVFCDSKSAIRLAKNPTTHDRSKHIGRLAH